MFFSIASVQTKTAQYLTDFLQEKYNAKIQVAKLRLSYDGRVVLNQVFIEDHHQDTLIVAKELSTSLLNIQGLVSGNDLDFENTHASQLKLYLKRYKNEEEDNFSVFIQKFDSGKKTSEDFSLTIDEINLTDSYFSYTDYNLQQEPVIALEKLNVQASNLLIDNSDVYVQIASLRGTESNGIKVDFLQTDFAYTQQQMRLDNLVLNTDKTSIEAPRIYLNYEQVEDLSDFENKVNIDAQFEKSVVHTQDLNKLYNEFSKGNELKFSGNVSGVLNNLHLNNWKMSGMNRTDLSGDLTLKNILSGDANSIRVMGNYDYLNTNYYDVVNLLPNLLKDRIPKRLQKLGQVKLVGYLEAGPQQVVTDATLNSQLGGGQFALRINELENINNASYQGNLVFTDFNLGALLNNKQLGKVSIEVDVDGSGFSANQLNSKVKGNISSFYFNGYRYKNIQLSGTLKNPYFNGKLISNDPNLKLNFEGLIDASSSTNIIDFDAQIAYADLSALNFVQDTTAIFSGNLNLDLKGKNINDAEGIILFSDVRYQNNQNKYAFNQLQLQAATNEKERIIKITSPDVVNGEVRGNFLIEEIPNLFRNAIGSIYTNYKPVRVTPNQEVSFEFDIFNKIVEVVVPGIQISANTFIRGNLTSEESAFKLSFKSPQINIEKNKFYRIDLQVDNDNPLFNTYLKVDSIQTGFYTARDFNLINVTLKDTLFFKTAFTGGNKNDDEFDFSLYHTINQENKSVVGFRKSDFQFKRAKWFLNKNNLKDKKLVFDHDFKGFSLDTLSITHLNEEIRISGELTDSTYKNFELKFKDVDLQKVTPDIDSLQMKGIVNGNLNFLQKKGVYYPKSKIKIENVALNDVNYGNLNLDISGNESLTDYSILAELKTKEKMYLKANGGINVSQQNAYIDLLVDVNDFDLEAFSPIGGEVLTDFRGTATGDAHIFGDYANPDINGSLTLSEAGLKIPYLNVDLDFQPQAEVNLRKQQFIFNDIRLTDTKYDTQGVLNGSISHRNFQDWELDLQLTAPNRLLVLDTKQTEESLYFGTGFISGNASIAGPVEELFIDVNAKTEEGTIFKIPLSDSESIGDHSFIYFLTPEQKKAKEEGTPVNIKPVKGLEMAFELDVTKDAEVEVVVDQESGSTLRGSGAGTLLIEINTNGKFNMWGDFVAYEGIYNFKYAGLIQKEFEVVPGGNITWDGSPTRANLNVKALYKTSANPAILLENPTINRSIPVEVYINLNGELTSTDLSFEIDYPNLSSVVKSELEYRISDRQNTEIQALSLISQGSFFAQGGSGQNAPGNLLIERASGLFDDIFTDEDGKFKVGIDYVQGGRTPDQETADRFGVTLSTQISERVLINGRVGVPIGGVTESVVVGDVEIDFLLNEDGSLRAKLFNRENDIQYIGEELGYTQGVGLSYSVDFDTFKELIRKILNKELEQTETKKLRKRKNKQENKIELPSYIEFPGR
ncbi:translocation/assembly module TamB domain-containing protein [Mesonia sediminis]|uniref:Translocation/assembly module TamB domain-containing protein n=1 Tax=Mesonia sediminis TaxID=1703946 RepID=A0ABW5SC35_9FLAO